MIKKHNSQLLKMGLGCLMSAVLQSFSLTSFSMACGIYPGGVAGFSRLLSDISADFLDFRIPFLYPYILINLVLVVIVYKEIGKLFTVFSLFQVVMVTSLSSVFKPVPLFDDTILYAIFGGLINGLGTGVALYVGASSGGTDFLSVYYSNKYHKSMWNYVLLLNFSMVLLAGILYGYQRAAYTIIFQYMAYFMVNKMHRRYTHEAIIIITEKPQEVINAIFKNVRHGITKIEARGAYNNTNRTMLYTVVNAFETAEVARCALKGDPKAFIETRDTLDIYGNYYQKPLD